MALRWRWIRRVWITTGLTATVAFVGWTLIAFRARPEARLALQSDARVTVRDSADWWLFVPAEFSRQQPAALLLLPGGLVDPVAYAPLARAVADSGFRVVLMRLPLRGAFGRADRPEFLEQLARVLSRSTGPWVLAGHSRGGEIATRAAARNPGGIQGLVLLGTTHPRDLSLAHLSYYVGKVYGTADGVSPVAKVRANATLLPAQTHWTQLVGGNHSQFGAYGFQPLDHRATLSRAAQQAAVVRALLDALRSTVTPN